MITFIVNGEAITLQPGDQCSLPNGDVVVYLTGPHAEAHNILLAEHQKQVRRAIDFTKNKHSIKD
jgi:hypothetical protein